MVGWRLSRSRPEAFGRFSRPMKDRDGAIAVPADAGSCPTELLASLTTLLCVGMLANMNAEPLLHERHALDADSFVELRVWRVPKRVPGSPHSFKYALAYVVRNECVLRYDNEAGKGDHKHIGVDEVAYRFTTPEQLLADFWADVDSWRSNDDDADNESYGDSLGGVP